MALTSPGESPAYRAARNALLEQEIALRRLAESVAAARRRLPDGGTVPEDYAFSECDAAGIARPVSFASLFGVHDTLVVYSYMFGPEKQAPCPMCTPLLDGPDGVEDHLRQRLSIVVVAESPPQRLQHFARQRGWQRLRLVSTNGNRYNADYHGRTDDGDTTMLNVFRRRGDALVHFWGTELAHGPSDPGQHHRGLDPINPIFQMFDFTPEGRGDWTTKVDYGPDAARR